MKIINWQIYYCGAQGSGLGGLCPWLPQCACSSGRTNLASSATGKAFGDRNFCKDSLKPLLFCSFVCHLLMGSLMVQFDLLESWRCMHGIIYMGKRYWVFFIPPLMDEESIASSEETTTDGQMGFQDWMLRSLLQVPECKSLIFRYINHVMNHFNT